jgi:ADP-ribose pyrophosphatase
VSDGDTGPRAGRARVLARRTVYDGKVLSLHVDEVEEPGGIRALREVVRQPGSVATLPVEADGRITLVRQYRYPVDALLWELPAGRLDPGEDPEAGAQRELREEIGQRAERLERIAFYYTTPGFCDEAMHVFRGSGLVPSPAKGDEDERIEVRSFTLEELLRMVQAGEICEGKTLLAILLETARRRGVPG